MASEEKPSLQLDIAASKLHTQGLALNFDSASQLKSVAILAQMDDSRKKMKKPKKKKKHNKKKHKNKKNKRAKNKMKDKDKESDKSEKSENEKEEHAGEEKPL